MLAVLPFADSFHVTIVNWQFQTSQWDAYSWFHLHVAYQWATWTTYWFYIILGQLRAHIIVTVRIYELSVISGGPVKMAWRILRLWMEEWPPDMGGGCEYIEWAFADSRQAVVLQLEELDEVLTAPHHKNLTMLRKGYMSLRFGLVAGFCECGNEPPGSTKCEQFLDYLRTC